MSWRYKAFYGAVVLIILFLAFVIIGALASEFYKGEIVERFPDRQVDVWKNLVSVEVIPLRKPDVEHVTILSSSIDAVVWREDLRNGGTRFMRVIERDSPRRFVIERFRSSDGMTGTWEFTLREIEDRTEITVKEESLNKNLWKRAYYTIIGRDVLLKREIKSLRVSLFQRLINTP